MSKSQESKHTNRLINEISPYLHQHAHNPVDWHAWGKEALTKAKTENKPIFLSIGYSACHWCHRMREESFEDPEVAAFMNEHFVNIKVDREERPDLDGIYMQATMAMTGSGGWPMSVFLTPDLKPFYAGTYFPPVRRYNMPAFRDVLVDGTGELRSSSNSPTTTDNFYWADYLGKAYIANAFRWANAADPAAKLFINDYNLEIDNRKLDSTIKIINELKTAGVPIHGVGLQMHISINTSNAGIDNAFQKLAATGLLIHVSEMDVRINPSNTAGFTPTSTQLDLQAEKFKYVAQSYFQHVPAAQRFGITVWNLTDADSWIVVSGKPDFPTLYNGSYQKKPAFSGFVQGLK